MILFLLVSLFINGIISRNKPRYRPLTKHDVNKLKLDVRHRIDTFDRPDSEDDTKPLLPTLVRLSFHDCVGAEQRSIKPWGKCNGCLNVNDDDHAGIEFGAILPIEQVYLNKNKINIYQSTKKYSGIAYNNNNPWSNPSGINWSLRMSRADFWANAATLAVEYSIELAWIESLDPNAFLTPKRVRLQAIPKWDIVAEINYYTGRIDCPTSPYDTRNVEMNANWEYDALKVFFTDHLGFSSDRDIISIMGGHSLGRGHKMQSRENMINDITNNCCSGGDYINKWNIRPSHLLTNEYYEEQYYTPMRQVEVNKFWNGSLIPPEKAMSRQFQWKHSPFHDPLTTPHEAFYLNIDMALQFPRDLNQRTLFNTPWTGLEIINDTVGESNCTMWAIGCAVEECIEPDLIPNRCVGEVSELFNTQLWFEIYHVFGLPFYRDFGLSFFKMITINENNLISLYKKKIPNWRFVGTKSTKNINPLTGQIYIDEREPPTGIYMDLFKIQKWALKKNCKDLFKIGSFSTSPNKTILNRLNIYNGYIFIYIKRSIINEYEKYYIHQWFGSKININTKNILIEFSITIKDFIERSTDIVSEWSEGKQVFIITENEKNETQRFKNYFKKLKYLKRKRKTPRCKKFSFFNPFQG